MASSVVGIWIRSTPRRYSAAASPVRSPVSPPPRATKPSLRVMPARSAASSTCSTVCSDLWVSPCGNTKESARKPAASKEETARSRYRGATSSSATIITWRPFTASAAALPARVSRPFSSRTL